VVGSSDEEKGPALRESEKEKVLLFSVDYGAECRAEEGIK